MGMQTTTVTSEKTNRPNQQDAALQEVMYDYKTYVSIIIHIVFCLTECWWVNCADTGRDPWSLDRVNIARYGPLPRHWYLCFVSRCATAVDYSRLALSLIVQQSMAPATVMQVLDAPRGPAAIETAPFPQQPMSWTAHGPALLPFPAVPCSQLCLAMATRFVGTAILCGASTALPRSAHGPIAKWTSSLGPRSARTAVPLFRHLLRVLQPHHLPAHRRHVPLRLRLHVPQARPLPPPLRCAALRTALPALDLVTPTPAQEQVHVQHMLHGPKQQYHGLHVDLQRRTGQRVTAAAVALRRQHFLRGLQLCARDSMRLRKMYLVQVPRGFGGRRPTMHAYLHCYHHYHHVHYHHVHCRQASSPSAATKQPSSSWRNDLWLNVRTNHVTLELGVWK